ncbi:hypothetical protein GXW78_24550 [Roseomonas terrae]|uniref:Uncharacterized protein n=1 Tax=Neoroseomonas terrae TaxID=424799 RepID=A0ABS5EPH2_9PROT|nr:hypothetical protein [Neoroseomonas terrae]MBR0652850.1 hypothetical protein [Neoroseomonas terrae]
MQARQALWQIAKTGALCAVLGLLLYAVVTAVAEYAVAPWLIGLVLAAPLTAVVGHLVIEALRSGAFPERFGVVLRDTRPLAFWFNVLWFGACGLLLGALAGWCAVRLLGAT